jgi:predicted phosphoadenosine phosphosulfate sulfurtransferase
MHDAFKTAGPTCISFSGGRTSAYLLWRVLQAHGGKLPDDAQVLFANTGK